MPVPVVVSVHLAQSIDGRLALAGRATPLSTMEGQRAAHEARAANDAVLVGMNTVRVDDPRLTVRHCEGKNPLRVVLASRLDVDLHARVLERNGAGVLVIGAEGRATPAARTALEKAGAEVAVVRAVDGMVSVPDALRVLAERNVKSLLVEGGARVLTSFFRARCVRHVTIEIVPLLLGEPGTPITGALGVDVLEAAPRLTNVRVDRLGTSVVVRGELPT